MSAKFVFHKTAIASLHGIELKPHSDQRGCFERLFCAEEFKELGLRREIAQINHSMTRQKGVIRGLHFQYPPFVETKIVRCLRGAIFDVAVDLRANSATFLQWHGEILSAENGNMLYIPEGCAHGFQTIAPDAELLYLHTEYYHPEAEGGLHYADPRLGIKWMLACAEISVKDQCYPFIDERFRGIAL